MVIGNIHTLAVGAGHGRLAVGSLELVVDDAVHVEPRSADERGTDGEVTGGEGGEREGRGEREEGGGGI